MTRPYLLLLTVAGLAMAAGALQAKPRRLAAEVVNVYPTDPEAFTQGLLHHGGLLYESTGLRGKSSLREVDLRTGEILRRVPLAPQYFGEGLARIGGLLYQITWRENTAFVWDLETFQQVGQFEYDGDGWGLTHDGEFLIMTTGTHELFFRDPDTFEIVDVVPVTFNGRPLRGINEMDYVDGTLWANLILQDYIVGIDPTRGIVTDIVDCTGLLAPDVREKVDVLNGIAWNEESETFYITGKLWPSLFEVRFVEPTAEEDEEAEEEADGGLVEKATPTPAEEEEAEEENGERVEEDGGAEAEPKAEAEEEPAEE